MPGQKNYFLIIHYKDKTQPQCPLMMVLLHRLLDKFIFHQNLPKARSYFGFIPKCEGIWFAMGTVKMWLFLLGGCSSSVRPMIEKFNPIILNLTYQASITVYSICCAGTQCFIFWYQRNLKISLAALYYLIYVNWKCASCFKKIT